MATVPARRCIRRLVHPLAAAPALVPAALVAGWAGSALALVVVAGAAAGLANSGST